MKCPRCRIARLVVIDVSLQGETVRMHLCSRCDLRWWERDGERIALDGVLELAAATRK